MNDLGAEVTAILGPVTVCIAITVWLVRVLNPDGRSNASAMGLATAYYVETDTDSGWAKLGGSLANALIFVIAVGGMTFLLVLAVKRGHTRWIFAYMGFAGFMVFFFLDGVISLQLLQLAAIPFDWPSLLLICYNAAVLGALTLFFLPAPLLLRQAYLVAIGVGTAFSMTWVPEWTTWVMLLAMSAYDVVAVLAPWGPLKELVELAEESGEPIPALVYTARASSVPDTDDSRRRRGGGGDGAGQVGRERGARVPVRGETEMSVQQQQQQHEPTEVSVPAVEVPHAQPDLRGVPAHGAARPEERGTDPEAARLLPPPPTPSPGPASPLGGEDDGLWLPDGIRLGLGDFIFYSVLVGRASMHSLLTAAAAYLAIVAGLICTLAWLSVSHSALPALPVSIVLGTVTYFAARFALEPSVLPLTLHGVCY